MNDGELIKFLKIDLILGIRLKWKIFLLVFAVFLIEIQGFINLCDTYYQSGEILSHPGVLDCIAYIFAGKENFIIEARDIFSVPTQWLIVNLCFMYVVGYYPADCLKKQSENFLIRSHSRTQFWISKLIWCLITVVLLFIILFVSAIILVAFSGDFSFCLHNEICKNILSFSFDNSKSILLLIPFLIILMMTVFQVNISVLWSPVIANLVVVIYMICSVYYSNYFFAYNYCMLCRSMTEYENIEMKVCVSIAVAFVLMLVSLIMAIKRLKKRDLL